MPQESVLFVDGRYFAKAEREFGSYVRLLNKTAVADWLEARGVKTLEFDGAHTSYERYLTLKKELQGIELKAGSSLLKNMRVIKEKGEIEALKRAADLTWRGAKFIKGLLKEGISEEEVAFEYEVFVRKSGASGLSFDSIIAFGENSAYPHHQAGKDRLKENQIVLMDVGAVVDAAYRGDLTRVIFFGEADLQLKNMLRWTREAQAHAIEKVEIGVTCGELDQAARTIFAKHGVEELFTHGLGHGIGLETHEFPSLKKEGVDKDVFLEAGMVFTIEPGLYRPGLGGVRWEDMILLTRSGVEKLFPDEL
jgi:Xaa-Pro aminopeptidase